MKNHSMLEELGQDPWEAFKKRVGHTNGNPLGIRTPLGHSYSLLLETIAREGLDDTPHPMEFLKFVIDYLGRQGLTDAERVVRAEGLDAPTIENHEARAVQAYMSHCGVSERGIAGTMEDILGPTRYG